MDEKNKNYDEHSEHKDKDFHFHPRPGHESHGAPDAAGQKDGFEPAPPSPETAPPAAAAQATAPAMPAPQPAAAYSQAPPATPPQASGMTVHLNNPGTLILQWLTYAFWGWTVLILSVLTYAVFTDFLDQGDSSSFNYYVISAALVLLPISLVCDYYYSKQEAQRKQGAASLVMVIHAVLFALFGIGSLIWGVFSLVSLMTDSNFDSSTGAGLYSSLIIAVFYGATFARTLNPPRFFSWLPKAYKIFMLVFVSLFIVLGFFGAHHNVKPQPSYSSNNYNYDDTSSSTSSSYSTRSTTNYPDKEEVNKQGQRRPVQYLHICDTAGGIEYVSQGTPKCLGSDTYRSDYDPSVAGTVFSSPCETTSGKLRYVYISNDERCPAGTRLLFYNSLGGSTSGPSI